MGKVDVRQKVDVQIGEVNQNDRNNRLLDYDSRNLFISCWNGAYAGRCNNVRGDTDE